MKKIKEKTLTEKDKDYLILDPPDFFSLGCCDCNLRHTIIVEKMGKNKIRLGIFRDSQATKDRRQLAKLKKYVAKQKTKIKKPSR